MSKSVNSGLSPTGPGAGARLAGASDEEGLASRSGRWSRSSGRPPSGGGDGVAPVVAKKGRVPLRRVCRRAILGSLRVGLSAVWRGAPRGVAAVPSPPGGRTQLVIVVSLGA